MDYNSLGGIFLLVFLSFFIWWYLSNETKIQTNDWWKSGLISAFFCLIFNEIIVGNAVFRNNELSLTAIPVILFAPLFPSYYNLFLWGPEWLLVNFPFLWGLTLVLLTNSH
jgi:hypothetical protein